MLENRRSHLRKRATGPVHYCCSDLKKNPSKSFNGLSDVGIVLNMSDSGLCFLTTAPLEVGQVVVVHCPWIGDKPEGGIVRWCRKAAIDLWRIGFQKTILQDNPA